MSRDANDMSENVVDEDVNLVSVSETLPKNYYIKNPGAERVREFGPYSFEDSYGKTRKLTLLMKAFADAYLSSGGNALTAFMDSHPDSKAKMSNMRTRAKELLMNPSVSAYITKNLSKFGFSDMNVELQHLFLLNQQGDMRVKMQAIDTFYKLRGAYNDDKTNGTEEELAQALNKIAGILADEGPKENKKEDESPKS